MSDKEADEIDKLKEVEFYAANVNAWFNTRFEHDKSLLALSAGGIGLLITLISALGVSSVESLVLYVLALMSFLICLAALLWIFRRNANHLEDIVHNRAIEDKTLKILDQTALISFMLGALFATIIGVSTAVKTFLDKECIMADKKVPTFDSIQGAGRMQPSTVEKKSVQGAANLRPQPSTSSTPSQSSPEKQEKK